MPSTALARAGGRRYTRDSLNTSAARAGGVGAGASFPAAPARPRLPRRPYAWRAHGPGKHTRATGLLAPTARQLTLLPSAPGRRLSSTAPGAIPAPSGTCCSGARRDADAFHSTGGPALLSTGAGTLRGAGPTRQDA